MTRYQVVATGHVDAPAKRVYAIIADYRESHPRIVPPRWFRNLTVDEGGYGGGTRIRFDVHVLGIRRTVRAEIAEPEPGRVLAETDLDRHTVTTFTVRDAAGGSADVTIASTLEMRAGILGRLERWMTTRLLRKIYAEELSLLAAYARKVPGREGTRSPGARR